MQLVERWRTEYYIGLHCFFVLFFLHCIALAEKHWMHFVPVQSISYFVEYHRQAGVTNTIWNLLATKGTIEGVKTPLHRLYTVLFRIFMIITILLRRIAEYWQTASLFLFLPFGAAAPVSVSCFPFKHTHCLQTPTPHPLPSNTYPSKRVVLLRGSTTRFQTPSRLNFNRVNLQLSLNDKSQCCLE